MKEVEISVKKYRSVDGKLFDNKNECIEYERENCKPLFDIIDKAKDIKEYCNNKGCCEDCVFASKEAVGDCVLYYYPLEWKV